MFKLFPTTYVKKHLDEINTDGEHPVIHRGKWHFDNIAIARLEEMRELHNWNQNNVLGSTAFLTARKKAKK